jgi:Ankyrin repeats (3 copies)
MAVLQLDRICVERTPTKILMALQSLPSKLEDTYKETLLRIQNQAESDSTLGMRVLQWISLSKRPLLVNELRHALAVEWKANEDPPRNLDVGNLLNPEDILDVCAGLVVIKNESQVIRLLHFTTQEFFRRSPESLFPDADTQISKTCLAYLSFDVFRENICISPEELEARLQLFPFLNYAAHHWGNHLPGKPERDLERPALNLLTDHISLMTLIQVKNISVHLYKDYCQPRKMTGLHFASVFGLHTLAAKLLLEKGTEVDPKDSYSRTPLLLAAENGHEAVVRLLLEKGAKVDSRTHMVRRRYRGPPRADTRP